MDEICYQYLVGPKYCLFCAVFCWSDIICVGTSCPDYQVVLMSLPRVDLKYHIILVSIQRMDLRYWGVLISIGLLAQIIEVSPCLFQGWTSDIIVSLCLFQGELEILWCLGLGRTPCLDYRGVMMSVLSVDLRFCSVLVSVPKMDLRYWGV